MTLTRDRVERVTVVASTVAALALLPGVPGPVRAVATLTWALVVPGLAWVRLLPLSGPVEQAAAVVALSLALDVLVAEALLYAGIDAPVVALAVLVASSGLGLALGRRPELVT